MRRRAFGALCTAVFAWIGLDLINCAGESVSAAPDAQSSCCSPAEATVAPGTGSIPQFSGHWTTDGGRNFEFPSLGGHPCVIAMFYASCDMTCPMTLQAMRDIEAALPGRDRDNARFILVTLDPVNDTAKALKSYRRTQGLANSRWILLRGSTDAVAQLAAILGVNFGEDAFGRRSHSTEISLLDERGRIILRQPNVNGDFRSMIAYLRSGRERWPNHDQN